MCFASVAAGDVVEWEPRDTEDTGSILGPCGSLSGVCLMRCPAVNGVYCAVSLSSVAHGNLMAVPDSFQSAEWGRLWTLAPLDYRTLEQLGHLSEYPWPVHT